MSAARSRSWLIRSVDMRTPKINPLLTQLWDFAGREAKAVGLEKRFTPLGLGPIGLNLIQEPNRIGYIHTPLNALSFAGSDELFFSFLKIAELPRAAHPIVMTVMGGYLHPNGIVGASFQEFLSLGSLAGFDALDSLASFFEEGGENSVARLEEKAQSLSQQAASMLSRLRDEFQLTPWEHIGGRLRELEQKWGQFVELSDEAKLA